MNTFNIMEQQVDVLELCIKLMKMLDIEDLNDEEYELINEINDKINNISTMLLYARYTNTISFWTASILNLFNINKWIKIIQYKNYVRKS